ncbi:uncharacterized protein N7483_012750 [Penicillium malachiteum]|uniref:uncharacterized protein n=1 Tax=Penicillium malachiteum TaxID=1324776 RepID=UPI0025474E92|nr:uncharacterized protein N7483_012750 [Penicillium malachiteum]KAJ5715569.1 hypothetical protein N7483_012750 [Penicillium malachiteum]
MPDITVFPEVPAFLKTCPWYFFYLARGQIDLVHPPFKKNLNGEIIVTLGEVFCRVPDCKNGRSPLPSTSYLRSHLRGHGYVVEQAKNGRLNKTEQVAAMEWFEHLMRNQEHKKGGNGDGHGHTHEKKRQGKKKGNEKEHHEDEVEEEDEDLKEYECY